MGNHYCIKALKSMVPPNTSSMQSYYFERELLWRSHDRLFKNQYIESMASSIERNCCSHSTLRSLPKMNFSKFVPLLILTISKGIIL